MTDSDEQAARKLLEERWMTQKEVQDKRNWLIREVLALQSQLDSLKEAYDELAMSLQREQNR